MAPQHRPRQGQKQIQAGTSTGRNHVGGEPIQALDTGVVDDGAGFRQPVGLAQEGALALVAFHQVDLRATQDGEDEAGKSGAATHIDQGPGGAWNEGVELRRIEDVAAPRIGQAGPADQVEPALPADHKRDQDFKTRHGIRRDAMGLAQGPRRQRRLFHVKPRRL